jgi:hypothetical protein
MNDRRTTRKIVRVIFVLGAVCAVGYVVLIVLTRKTLTGVGSSIRSGLSSTEIAEHSLPPGSVLLLDDDTLGTLVAFGRLNSVNEKDSLQLFAGHLRSGVDQKIVAADNMVVIRVQEFTANQPEVMRFAPRSSVSGRSSRGRLLLRAGHSKSGGVLGRLGFGDQRLRGR